MFSLHIDTARTWRGGQIQVMHTVLGLRESGYRAALVAHPDGELATPTLAELYLKQGYPEKAAEVYRAILAREPGNREVAARLAEVDRAEARRAGQRRRLEGEIRRLEALLSAVQRSRRA